MSIENQHQLLDDIDSRQDEILRQLDELNRNIEQTIRAIVGDREGADSDEATEASVPDAERETSTGTSVVGHDATNAASIIASFHASSGVSADAFSQS